jgi:hypothetical protein
MVFYSLQGVNGVYESGRGGGCGSRIWVGENRSVSWSDPHRQWRPVSDFHEHYPAEWKAHMDAARAAGHGGGDYHTARLFAASVLDGTPPDIDVYQALEWTAAGLCSQISAANGGVPIRVPDFRDPRQRPVTLDAPPSNP